LKCKMPNLAIIDASEKDQIIIGQALEMDKQSAKLLGLDWKNTYLKLIDESFSRKKDNPAKIDKLIEGS